MMTNTAKMNAQLKRLWFSLLLSKSQGFTLLDVLVAMLVLTSFISVSMAAMSTSVLVKVRARVTAESTNWINQDLEAVRQHSAQLSYVLASAAAAGQPQVTLVNTNGLAVGERIGFAGDSTTYIIQQVSGTSVRLTTNLVLPKTINTSVIPLSKCNATTTAGGLANVLQTSLPAVVNRGSFSTAGKNYTLTRTATVSPTAPHSVLQLVYTVTPQGSTTRTNTMYTEVIPNAAFQCARIQ